VLHNPVFLFSNPDVIWSTYQRPICTKFGHNTWIHIPSKCWKFCFRIICLQKPQNWRGQTGTLQGLKRCLTASGIFLWHQMGELGTPRVVSIFCLWEMCVCLHTVLLHGAFYLDQRRLKMRHSAQRCGLDDVPLKLGSQVPSPKKWHFGPWIGLSRVSDKNSNITWTPLSWSWRNFL